MSMTKEKIIVMFDHVAKDDEGISLYHLLTQMFDGSRMKVRSVIGGDPEEKLKGVIFIIQF